MTGKEEEATEKLLPCSFQFHDFVLPVGDLQISCQIIKMEDSFYLWVGDFNERAMNDLSLAIMTKYEVQPVSTRLMGSVADATSTNMAQRLAKKYGKPVYVSFNVTTNNLLLPGIEKAIQEHFKNHPDVLCFSG
ncbi:proteasome assembly chaperone 4 isoform X2 [Orussus abietinus]|nr:proteasome assembly chaperone 4 isoform X2 [Orussus abietinus]